MKKIEQKLKEAGLLDQLHQALDEENAETKSILTVESNLKELEKLSQENKVLNFKINQFELEFEKVVNQSKDYDVLLLEKTYQIEKLRLQLKQQEIKFNQVQHDQQESIMDINEEHQKQLLEEQLIIYEQQAKDLQLQEEHISQKQKDIQLNEIRQVSLQETFIKELNQKYYEQRVELEKQRFKESAKFSQANDIESQKNLLEIEQQIKNVQNKEKNQESLKKQLDTQTQKIENLKEELKKMNLQKQNFMKDLKENRDNFERFKSLSKKEIIQEKKIVLEKEKQIKLLKTAQQKQENIIKKNKKDIEKLKKQKEIIYQILQNQNLSGKKGLGSCKPQKQQLIASKRDQVYQSQYHFQKVLLTSQSCVMDMQETQTRSSFNLANDQSNENLNLYSELEAQLDSILCKQVEIYQIEKEIAKIEENISKFDENQEDDMRSKCSLQVKIDKQVSLLKSDRLEEDQLDEIRVQLQYDQQQLKDISNKIENFTVHREYKRIKLLEFKRQYDDLKSSNQTINSSIDKNLQFQNKIIEMLQEKYIMMFSHMIETKEIEEKLKINEQELQKEIKQRDELLLFNQRYYQQQIVELQQELQQVYLNYEEEKMQVENNKMKNPVQLNNNILQNSYQNNLNHIKKDEVIKQQTKMIAEQNKKLKQNEINIENLRRKCEIIQQLYDEQKKTYCKDKFIGIVKSETSEQLLQVQEFSAKKQQLQNLREKRNELKMQKTNQLNPQFNFQTLSEFQLRTAPHNQSAANLTQESDVQLNKSESLGSDVQIDETRLNYNCQRWECVQKYENCHSSQIFCLESFGNLMFSTSNKYLKIWDLEKNKCQSEIPVHTSFVKGLFVSKENSLIFTSSEKNISIWDLDSLQLITTLKGPKENVNKIYVNNQHLYTATKGTLSGAGLYKWDLRNLGHVEEAEKNQDIFSLLAVDNVLYCGNRNHQVRRVSIPELEVLSPFDPPHFDTVNGLSNLSEFIISGSRDSTLKLWTKDGTLKQTTYCNKQVTCLLENQNLQVVYSGLNNGKVKVWALTNSKLQCISDVLSSNLKINAICNLQNNSFATGQEDKTIKIWKPQPQTLNQLLTLNSNSKDMELEI